MSLISFSGIASGIDSSSLIRAILDRQRASRIQPLEDRSTTLKATNDSFDKLSDLLQDLKSASSKFRALNGGALSKLGTSSNEVTLSAVASNSATNVSTSVTVNQIARAGTLSFNDSNISDSSQAVVSGLSGTGSITFQTGTGANQESISVTVDNTTSLDGIAAAINSQSSKANASVVNVGTSSSPDYRLVLTSNSQGGDLGTVSASVSANIQAQGRFTAQTVNQAQDAQLTIAGISGTITRSSNSISDVIPGVTLNLAATGSAVVTVADDSTGSLETLQDYVDSYNKVVSFLAENNLVAKDGNDPDSQFTFGTLSGTSIDENVIRAIRNDFFGSSKSGGAVNTLADLGIKTNRDGTLSLDATTFNSALSSDSNSVRSILETLGESQARVGGTLDQYVQFNGLIDSAISGNKASISGIDEQIAKIEKSLASQEQSLIAQFAGLEGLIGKLQGQQNALTGLTG